MGKLKILIAEDQRLDKELYDKGIPDELYEKKFVEDGEEALKIYQAWKPDILLLDLMMPIKSGFSVLQDIRNEGNISKKTAVIVSTILSKKEDIMDCAKFDIQGYIIKPIKPSEINNKISSCYQKFLDKLES